MLQQTRVEAAIPYYRLFLERFPSLASLASAAETDVLAAWSGLGYYSRARNLHRAAIKMNAEGIPASHAGILALPGAGEYTAAAIASIALGLPHAAVDGNVIRVISRLTNDAAEITAPAVRRRFAAEAQRLLDPARPGEFNQAMMELGATICVPRTPDCSACPVAKSCAARAAGTQRELPVKLKKNGVREVGLELVLLERDASIFLVKRASGERRLADFWELPGKDFFPDAQADRVSTFRHQIVNDRFTVGIWSIARKPRLLPPGDWVPLADLHRLPLTTVTKKALQIRQLR